VVTTVLILVAAGAILLLLEIVLPGMVAGIVGLCCLVAGVALAYTDFGAGTGTMVLIGVCLGLLAGTVCWFKFFPNSRLGRLFVSQGKVGELGVDQQALLHQTGVAKTLLRPSGTAVIGGRRVDVVTEGSLIEPGTMIKVVAVEGMRVVVRALDPGS
jgi:membrane-bound serine protease (ClpP class)